jgi:hypothetical protein
VRRFPGMENPGTPNAEGPTPNAEVLTSNDETSGSRVRDRVKRRESYDLVLSSRCALKPGESPLPQMDFSSSSTVDTGSWEPHGNAGDHRLPRFHLCHPPVVQAGYDEKEGALVAMDDLQTISRATASCCKSS